jgi:hypothetical protein
MKWDDFIISNLYKKENTQNFTYSVPYFNLITKKMKEKNVMNSINDQ